MRLTAACVTWRSSPAAAKLPRRAAASKARSPLSDGRRRTVTTSFSWARRQVNPVVRRLARTYAHRQRDPSKNGHASASILATLAVGILGTSFLSGIFGMAGGMLLMGLSCASSCRRRDGAAWDHANGVERLARTLWRAHVRWPIVARYAAGSLVAAAAFAAFAAPPTKADSPTDSWPHSIRRAMLCPTRCA